MRKRECQPTAGSGSQSSNSFSNIWSLNGLWYVVLICLWSLISWLLNLFSQCCMRNGSFCRDKLFPKTYLEEHYFCCPVEDLPLQIPTHCKDTVRPSSLYFLSSFDAANKSSKYTKNTPYSMSMRYHLMLFVDHVPTALKITIFSFRNLITEPFPTFLYNEEGIAPNLEQYQFLRKYTQTILRH